MGTNRCEGQAGAVCEYACNEGYFDIGGAHVCGSDGAFAGGECYLTGTVICPEGGWWQNLTSPCEALDLATDAGMATRTMSEAILAAQEKWSHCGVAECQAPSGADQNFTALCEGVVFAEGAEDTWAASCTSLGCDYTAPVTIAAATCDGEACAGEFEIGATDVELQA